MNNMLKRIRYFLKVYIRLCGSCPIDSPEQILMVRLGHELSANCGYSPYTRLNDQEMLRLAKHLSHPTQ